MKVLYKFKPYHNYSKISRFAFLLNMFGYAAIVYWFATRKAIKTIDFYDIIEFILIMLVIIFNFIVIRFLQNESKTMIVFEEEGLYILNSDSETLDYTEWKNFQFAYIVRNFRSFWFVVLTDKTINFKEAKQYANSAKMYDVLSEKVVIFSLPDDFSNSVIKDIIKQKIKNSYIEDVVGMGGFKPL